MQVKDRVIVVTGAGAGIGLALAKRFVSEGAKAVIGADISSDLVEVCEAAGVHPIAADVSSENSIVSLIEETEERIGPIDLFVANAGIGGLPGGAEVPDDEWQRIWDINVMHHIWAARHMVPRWTERGGGYLLTTASAAGLLSNLGTAPYTVTKHAAVGLAEWLAITHVDDGIKVSVLCPQGVRTAMTEGDDPAVTNVVAHGLVEPEDVADAVISGLEAETFHILPHPQVADYVRHKADNIDNWLGAMVRLQRKFFPRSAG